MLTSCEDSLVLLFHIVFHSAVKNRLLQTNLKNVLTPDGFLTHVDADGKNAQCLIL